MPIPNPKKEETEKDFIGRCESALANDYTDSEQRTAICYKSWRSAKLDQGETLMKLYAEINKIDEEKRMVWGYASTESLDSQGEVVRLDAVKGAWPEYMKFANIREMHQPKAAGTVEEYSFDAKGVMIGAHVVDNEAWEKVQKKVYKGFSIGGRALDRKTEKVGDKDVPHITKMLLTEISLVDRPANPEATITMFKGATAEDMEKMAVDELAKFVDDKKIPADQLLAVVMKAFDKGYSLEDGSFMIKSKSDIKAAVRGYLVATNGVKSSAKTHIIKTAKAMNAEDQLPLGWNTWTPEQDTAKGMYTVQQMASLVDSLSMIQSSTSYESEAEGDNSPIPGKIKEICRAVCDVLIEMVTEESAEMMDNMGGDGKETAMAAAAKPEDIQKMIDASIAKVTGELGKATETITKVTAENETLKKRLETLEAQPMPHKTARTVDKREDAGGGGEITPILKNDGTVDEVATAVKKAQATGGVPLQDLRK
jgi:hypothetical protein